MPPQDAQNALCAEVDRLIAAHPIFAEALEVAGSYPPPRQGTPGFVGLAEIIASQQISKSAANSILARLWQCLECTNNPAAGFAALDHDTKRACGLSRPKIRYLDGIAEACLSGTINPDVLAKLDNPTLIRTLTALPGLGQWSAEIYALFVLNRADILPAADLALQEAYRRLLRLEERPNEKTLRAMSDKYTPHRSAVARLLWHYYRGAPVK